MKSIGWDNDSGFIACGGENGLAKVLKLEMQSKDNASAQLTMNQSLDGHSSNIVNLNFRNGYRHRMEL